MLRVATPSARDTRSSKVSAKTLARNARPLNEQLEACRVLTPTAKGNLAAPSMAKWAGARVLASWMADLGLSGPMGLAVVYRWLMGFQPASGTATPGDGSPPTATPSSRSSPT